MSSQVSQSLSNRFELWGSGVDREAVGPEVDKFLKSTLHLLSKAALGFDSDSTQFEAQVANWCNMAGVTKLKACGMLEQSLSNRRELWGSGIDRAALVLK